MKRITVGEVQEAYRKTGLKPQVESMFDTCFNQYEPKCGCGLGAIYMAADGPKRMTVTVSDVAKYVGLDRPYATGFSDGFDGEEANPRNWCGLADSEDARDAYDLGYTDGKAAGDVMLARV